MDSIRGDISLQDGDGSAGPATITVNPYGYQSIGFDSILNPQSKWVVEMYRGDALIATVSSDSSNATRSGRVNLPDGGTQYGNAIYWRQLIPTSDVLMGDRWIVYGWNDGVDADAYPPDRNYFE